MKTEQKNKLVIGQTIYFVERDSRGRASDDPIVEGVIATIGKKYFTVTCPVSYSVRSSRFHIDNLIQDGGDYSPKIFGFQSKQDILDKHEMENSISEIRSLVGSMGQTSLSLAQMRDILKIIKQR